MKPETTPALLREAFEEMANARSKAINMPVDLSRWPDSPHPKNGGYKDARIFAAFEGFKDGVYWNTPPQPASCERGDAMILLEKWAERATLNGVTDDLLEDTERLIQTNHSSTRRATPIPDAGETGDVERLRSVFYNEMRRQGYKTPDIAEIDDEALIRALLAALTSSMEMVAGGACKCEFGLRHCPVHQESIPDNTQTPYNALDRIRVLEALGEIECMSNALSQLELIDLPDNGAIIDMCKILHGLVKKALNPNTEQGE